MITRERTACFIQRTNDAFDHKKESIDKSIRTAHCLLKRNVNSGDDPSVYRPISYHAVLSS